MDRRVRLIVSICSFVIGIFFLINSQSSVTGAIIGINSFDDSSFSLFLGIFFMALSLILFATTLELKRTSELERITLSSVIKESPALVRLTHKATKNLTIEKELNHLIRELGKGNFEAGLGHPDNIEGTNVFYLRGRNGARLYYRQTGENSYEIVGKSGKGKNQD